MDVFDFGIQSQKEASKKYDRSKMEEETPQKNNEHEKIISSPEVSTYFEAYRIVLKLKYCIIEKERLSEDEWSILERVGVKKKIQTVSLEFYNTTLDRFLNYLEDITHSFSKQNEYNRHIRSRRVSPTFTCAM